MISVSIRSEFTAAIPQATAQAASAGNMTAPMMESARFHLKVADALIMKGDTIAALNQINLAEIQSVITKYGLSGNINESNSSNGVYHRRLFIKHEDGGKLYH